MSQESEIVALRAQLSDKEKSLERIQAANDTLKREAMGKVNLALSRSVFTAASRAPFADLASPQAGGSEERAERHYCWYASCDE